MILNAPETKDRRSILPFEWTRADGIDEAWSEWEPLIEAYRRVSRDSLSVPQLRAELRATINEHGKVFVALDSPHRRLAGYMCVRPVRTMTNDEPDALLITQWFKRQDSKEAATAITDEFFRLASEYARSEKLGIIRIETRAVGSDGSVVTQFRLMLARFGFRPVYCGLEAKLDSKEDGGVN